MSVPSERDVEREREATHRRREREQRREERLDRQDHGLTPEEKVAEASRDSFPASDPPGWIGGAATKSGAENEERAGKRD